MVEPAAMIIGVDFDNTIVCYDAIFHRIAVERGLIPAVVPVTKTEVRDYLRRAGHESTWTEMQGYVYGPRLVEAEVFPGVKEFFRRCRECGVPVRIISHKTRYPYAGEPHDLHAAAHGWLEHNGFFASDDVGLPADAVFLELTKQAKLARIKAAECTHFIDDLPEFLADPRFPVETRRILFDPINAHADAPAQARLRSWLEISRAIFGSAAGPSSIVEAPAASGALFARAGLRLAAPPVRIMGGGNNRVFEAHSTVGDRFLLKQYFFHPSDQRNRFDAERLFLRLTAVTAPKHTPRAFGWDAAARLALLEFIDGRKLAAGEIGAEEMNAALAFFTVLNRGRGSAEALALPAAAEACFSLEEHCRTVERRMERLREIPADAPIDREAKDFVANELAATWADVHARVLAHLPGELNAVPDRCISPSDFGFHNSLRRPDGTLVFFDFEYAGWDDPAKTVCDFFCQPAIPVPASGFEPFARAVGNAVELADIERFVAQCHALLPLYRLKWCAIMLNEFVGPDRGRRAFALGAGVADERKATQLAAARRVLATGHNSLHGTIA